MVRRSSHSRTHFAGALAKHTTSALSVPSQAAETRPVSRFKSRDPGDAAMHGQWADAKASAVSLALAVPGLRRLFSKQNYGSQKLLATIGQG